MKLKAWITDAPGGGCCMQIIEQEGIKSELLKNGLYTTYEPDISQEGIWLRGKWEGGHDKILTVDRTAQSVIDQLTAGLAGHAVTREPKRGDIVEVWYSNRKIPEKRIFVHKDKSCIFCVFDTDEDKNNFYNDKVFRVTPWEHMRLPQPVRYSKEGDVHTWSTEAEKAGEG